MKLICEFRISDTDTVIQSSHQMGLDISKDNDHYTWESPLNVDGIERGCIITVSFCILSCGHAVPMRSVDLDTSLLTYTSITPKLHTRRHSTHNREKYAKSISCDCIKIENTSISYVANKFSNDALIRLKITSIHTVIPYSLIHDLISRDQLRITVQLNGQYLYKANIVKYNELTRRKTFTWLFDEKSDIIQDKCNRLVYDCDYNNSAENSYFKAVYPITNETQFELQIIKDVFFPFTNTGYEPQILKYTLLKEPSGIYGLDKGIAICLTPETLEMYVDNYPQILM